MKFYSFFKIAVSKNRLSKSGPHENSFEMGNKKTNAHKSYYCSFVSKTAVSNGHIIKGSHETHVEMG